MIIGACKNPPLPHIVAVRGDFMEQTYPVTSDGEVVGTVKIQVQGLYYQLQCTCRLSTMQRVSLFAGHDELGILVPENGLFCLSKKIPRKRFSGDPIQFHLVNREDKGNSILIPVSAEKPFSGIDKLEKAKFVQTADGPMLKLPVN